jgi:uncharacterized membrane protein YphA (DoxX/SURF4 family)
VTSKKVAVPSGGGGRPLVHLLLRLIVGGVLCYAGFLKATAPTAEFAAAIEAYHLFPSFLLTPTAYALPWIEMWVGLFLITGFLMRYAAWSASLLFVLFLAVVASALLRGIDLASCGCFGGEAFSPHYTILIDCVLLVFSILLVRLKPAQQRFALDV